MIPVQFPEANITFAKDQPEYQPLPAFVPEDGMSCLTCWELSDAELTQILLTKRVWLTTMHFGQPLQPQLLQVFSPLQ